MKRWVVGIGSLAVLVVLCWPAFSTTEIDSLPVSNYSMFAHPRPRASSFQMAVIVDSSGVERRLSAKEVGATDQPMQAVVTLQHAIRSNAAMELCREIAARVHTAGTIQVLTAKYDAINWFRGDREPVAVNVHAECTSRAD